MRSPSVRNGWILPATLTPEAGSLYQNLVAGGAMPLSGTPVDEAPTGTPNRVLFVQ